jgi:hypothetical protein
MITGIVNVTGTSAPSYVDVLHQITGIPSSLVLTESEVSGEVSTDYIRSWKMTLTNLGTDFNTDAADFNTSVYVGPWKMLEPDVIAAGEVWQLGTKLAPGKSITYTGQGETLYVLGDPAATSPDVNADVLVVFQWT